MKGFRDFLNQGNVVQLAVAFVIGGAFGAVVTALVVDIINPIIAIPFGKPNFNSLVLTINGSVIKYGTFLTAVIAFILIAAGVYFFFVVPYNRLQARRAMPRRQIEHARMPRVPEHHSQGGAPLLACTAVVEPMAASRGPDVRGSCCASRRAVAAGAPRHPRGASGRLCRRAELRLCGHRR